MTPEELQHTVTLAGYPCRIRNGEVVVNTCLFCGNEKGNLELSASKGVYHCWACRSGGRLDGLLTKLTGQTHQIEVNRTARKATPAAPPDALDFKSAPIADVLSASTYLGRRGITVDTAAMYGMRICNQVGHLLEGRIVIPAREFWTSQLLGWMGRSYTGKRPKYLSTLTTSAVVGWRQTSRKAPIVVVEGALDGIAVHRAGYTAAVLGGQGGADDAEMFGARAITSPLIVMLDGDAAQQATALYWRLSTVHPDVRVRYLDRGQDPAGLGPEHIRDLLGQSPLAPDRLPE